MSISKQCIEEIAARVDIVAEIGSRMALKKSGSNFVGLCPFHGEKSPSFSVSPAKQFFHCFGCGKSGDAIQFLMEHDGMQFQEAVRDLGERLGVKIKEDQSAQDVAAGQMQRQALASLEEVCEQACAFYQQALPRFEAPGAYVAKRGLSAEVIAAYGIGYAPGPASRKALAGAFADYASPALVEAGLVAQHTDESGRIERFDRFRSRLMFPIRNVRGRCIGFGARVLGEGKPKYLNSPETPLFLKHKVLYGLHEGRAHIAREKLAFVTEGYMDVVSMAQYGVGNAVATLGTAITQEHLRLLLRFTDRVCFVFDGDAPGKKAAQKALRVALPLLEAKHSFSFLTLPDALDPDDYLRAFGKARFERLVQSAPTLSQYLLATLLEQYGTDGKLDSAEAKAQFDVAARELAQTISPTNPLRELVLQEIDAALGRVPRRPGAGGQGGAPRRPWLPRQEWLKTQQVGAPAAPAPVLQRKTLWQRLASAAQIAPQAAHGVLASISPLLDPHSPEEAALLELLHECDRLPFHPERHAGDVLQGAIDLLQSAKPLIVKQRLIEVRQELERLHAQGELSEGEYVEQMLRLKP